MFRLFKSSKPGAVVSLGPAAPYYDVDTPSTKEEVPAPVVEDKPAVLRPQRDTLAVETKPPLVTRDSVGSELFVTPTAELPEPPLEKVETKQDDAPGIPNEPVVAATPAVAATATPEDAAPAELEHASAVGADTPSPAEPGLPAQAPPAATANGIIASAASPSEPVSPKPRRRSLPGFGFWGNKKHAEAVAQEAVLPPTPTTVLTPVVEAPPATAAQLVGAGHLEVPASGPPKRKKSLKKQRPKADAAKHQDTVSPGAVVVPVAGVVAESPAVDTAGAHASPVDDVPAHTNSVVPPAAMPPPAQQGSGPLKKERHVMVKKSERKAEEAAVGVRTLIVGPDPEQPRSKPLTKSEVNKLKGQLLEPKSAGKIIQRLRNLPVPAPARPSVITHDTLQHSMAPEADVARAAMASHAHPPATKQGPIHAVCLDCTDREADELHFSQLGTAMFVNPSFAVADTATAFPVLRNMHIISLLKAPDFGLGAPIGSTNAGILSGSIPSPAVIADGILQLSQQLVALGFATGATVHTNHSGIYPPLDRISVMTYWWGLEVLIPKVSMEFLAQCKSVQSTVLNVLTALATFHTGVREILPFIRYISQFIDFEWNAIQSQNKGNGVVCAATWVMPAAMVPRPWDFAAPPDDPNATPPEANQTRFDFVPNYNAGPILPEVKVTPATLPRNVTFKDKDTDVDAPFSAGTITANSTEGAPAAPITPDTKPSAVYAAA